MLIPTYDGNMCLGLLINYPFPGKMLISVEFIYYFVGVFIIIDDIVKGRRFRVHVNCCYAKQLSTEGLFSTALLSASC